MNNYSQTVYVSVILDFAHMLTSFLKSMENNEDNWLLTITLELNYVL